MVEQPHQTESLVRTILTAVGLSALGFFILVLMLQPVFSGRVELAQSFSIGPLRIQWYGLVLGVAALNGYLLATRRRRQAYNIDESQADTIILVALVVGFVGARLYHVISELGVYIQEPGQILAVWNGGLSIFGAAMGAVLGVWVYYQYFLKPQTGEPKISFWVLLDWLTPSVVIGQIIGRFGNFFNYELYGSPTNLPWKMFVPIQFRLPAVELSQFFHPLFLYEAAGSAIILVLLLKLKLPAGRLFLLWLLLYNVMRFFLEFLRVDSVVYSGVRINAIVAAVLAGLAVALWWKLNSKDKIINNAVSSSHYH